MKQRSIRLGLRVRWWLDFLAFVISEAIWGPIWYVSRYCRNLRGRISGDALLMEALAATANVNTVLPVVKAWLETHGGRRQTYTWAIYPSWNPTIDYIVIRSGYSYLKLNY